MRKYHGFRLMLADVDEEDILWLKYRNEVITIGLRIFSEWLCVAWSVTERNEKGSEEPIP